MRLFLLLIFCALFFVSVSSVSAHKGGKPFVRVNGEFMKENNTYPYVPGNLKSHIHDGPTKAFLVNEPITFEIDPDNVMLPPQTKQNMMYRFVWAGPSDVTATGTKVSQSFSQPGSYILKIEGKPATGSDYLVLGSAQIDVLPTAAYQRPKATLKVLSTSYKAGESTSFSVDTQTDPSAHIVSYKWFSSSMGQASGQNTQFTIPEDSVSDALLVQITDSNNLIVYDGIGIRSEEGDLVFEHLADKSPVPGTSDFRPNKLILPLGVGAVVLMGGVFLWKKRKRFTTHHKSAKRK